jgi:hypothetical protein
MYAEPNPKAAERPQGKKWTSYGSHIKRNNHLLLQEKCGGFPLLFPATETVTPGSQWWEKYLDQPLHASRFELFSVESRKC